MRSTFILAALAFLLTSCGSLFPTPTPIPTDTPAPTATPAPTLTPTLEPTLAPPTAIPTFDFNAPGALECSVRAQSLKNGTKLDPKERFDMAWQVKNTGEATWDPRSIQFTYYSGSRLQISDSSPLRETVNPGDVTSLVTDMIAPRSSGAYTTIWTLRRDDNDFCHMSLTIVVR